MIRSLFVLFGVAAVTVGAAVTAPSFASALAALSLVVILLVLSALILPIGSSEVSRTLPSGPIEAGEPFRVRTVVRLPFGVPAVVDVADGIKGRTPRRVRSLCVGRAVDVGYPLVLSRGVYDFAPVTIETRDPFGLLSRSVGADLHETVTVWPRGSAAEGRRLHDLLVSRQARSCDEAALRSIRPATPEDPLRAIHWGQSAKRGSLYARELEAERSQVVAVAVRAHGPAFERALEQASSLVRYAYAVGRPMSLDLGCAMIGPGVGRLHFEKVMRALSEVDIARHDPSAVPAPGFVAIDGEDPAPARVAT